MVCHGEGMLLLAGWVVVFVAAVVYMTHVQLAMRTSSDATEKCAHL